MSLLTSPDADGDEEFFEDINRAFHILSKVAAPEAYNNFCLEAAEIILNEAN